MNTLLGLVSAAVGGMVLGFAIYYTILFFRADRADKSERKLTMQFAGFFWLGVVLTWLNINTLGRVYPRPYIGLLISYITAMVITVVISWVLYKKRSKQ